MTAGRHAKRPTLGWQAPLGIVVVATGASLLLGTGTSYSYWKAPGTGTGSATTGTMTVTATTTAVSGLYPGANLAVIVTVTNTSAAGLLVSSIVPGTVAKSGSPKGTCDPTVVTFTARTLPTTKLAAGKTGSYDGTMSMNTLAADGCQGATFTLPLTINGKSA